MVNVVQRSLWREIILCVPRGIAHGAVGGENRVCALVGEKDPSACRCGIPKRKVEANDFAIFDHATITAASTLLVFGEGGE